MFANCYCLIKIDLSNFRFKSISDISFMFANCYSLVDIIGCKLINDDLVDEKRYFLEDCSALPNITNWDMEITKITLQEFDFQRALDDYKLH